MLKQRKMPNTKTKKLNIVALNKKKVEHFVFSLRVLFCFGILSENLVIFDCRNFFPNSHIYKTKIKHKSKNKDICQYLNCWQFVHRRKGVGDEQQQKIEQKRAEKSRKRQKKEEDKLYDWKRIVLLMFFFQLACYFIRKTTILKIDLKIRKKQIEMRSRSVKKIEREQVQIKNKTKTKKRFQEAKKHNKTKQK